MKSDAFAIVGAFEDIVQIELLRLYHEKQSLLSQLMPAAWPTPRGARDYALIDQLFYACVRLCEQGNALELRSIAEKLPCLFGLLKEAPTGVPTLSSSRCVHLADATFASPVFVYDFKNCPSFEDSSTLNAAASTARRLGFETILSAGLGVAVKLDPQTDRDHLESYTVTALRGTIFLDLSKSVLRNGETLVHESAHNWLNAAFAALKEPLASTPTWWSPWRGTDRPLAGILHGIFAFGCVVEFLRRAILSGTGSAEDRDYARHQIENQRTRLELLATDLPSMLNHLRSQELRLLFSALFQQSVAVLP